jgi:hypothetical protein
VVARPQKWALHHKKRCVTGVRHSSGTLNSLVDDGLNPPLTAQQVEIAVRWWRHQLQLASAERSTPLYKWESECFAVSLKELLQGRDEEYLQLYPWHPPGHHMHLSVHEGHGNAPLTWAARKLGLHGNMGVFPRHAAMHFMARFKPEGRVYAGRYGLAVEITPDLFADTFPTVQYATSARGKSRSR